MADTHNITAPLVSYLKRLRTLDEQSVLLTRKIEGVVNSALEETRSGKRGKGGDGGDKTLADRDDAGQTDLKKNLAIADEKVTLAQQAYDLVEQHIARLDKDLRLFDNALAEKEAQIAIGKGLVVPPTLAAGDGGTGSGAGNGNAVAVAGAEIGRERERERERERKRGSKRQRGRERTRYTTIIRRFVRPDVQLTLFFGFLGFTVSCPGLNRADGGRGLDCRPA